MKLRKVVGIVKMRQISLEITLKIKLVYLRSLSRQDHTLFALFITEVYIKYQLDFSTGVSTGNLPVI